MLAMSIQMVATKMLLLLLLRTVRIAAETVTSMKTRAYTRTEVETHILIKYAMRATRIDKIKAIKVTICVVQRMIERNMSGHVMIIAVKITTIIRVKRRRGSILSSITITTMSIAPGTRCCIMTEIKTETQEGQITNLRRIQIMAEDGRPIQEGTMAILIEQMRHDPVIGYVQAAK